MWGNSQSAGTFTGLGIAGAQNVDHPRLQGQGRRQYITVPRTDAAIDVLRGRAEASGAQGWIFPGPGKTGHLVEPKKGWQRLLRRAGIEDLRLHDLRRSLASFQIDAGVSLAVIGKGLGHHSQQTTAVYARLAQDPVADAWQKGTDAIMVAAGLKKTAEIVPMKKKGKRSA